MSNTPTPAALAAELKRLAHRLSDASYTQGIDNVRALLGEVLAAIDRLAALASDAHGEPVDAVKELELAAAHASTFPRDTMVVPLDEALGFVAQHGEPVATVHASWNDDEGFMLVKRAGDRLPVGALLYTRPAAPAGPADPVTEACRLPAKLVARIVEALEEAQTYTCGPCCSPSMTDELKELEREARAALEAKQ